MTFYRWLQRQKERTDAVGEFARYAIKDKLFPRECRALHLFLLRYEGLPERRTGVKAAHREWRRWRAQLAGE